METKTSQEWYVFLYPNKEVIVYDPDGWDRTNYDFSWYEEQITQEEFNDRVSNSTTLRYIK